MPDPTLTRRTVLAGAATTGGALAAAVALPGRALAAPQDAAPAPAPAPAPAADGKAARPLKLLMLGGTSFLGPEIVTLAVARGHTVTLFNRGKTHPSLFPDLEKLRGDRGGDVSALKGRAFDAVMDTSAYVPSHVTRVREALGDVGHYTLVSTISVYPAVGSSRDPVGESSPVAEVPAEAVAAEKLTNETYGAWKARCERAAEAGWPGRVAHVRPGLIVGPNDPTDRFTYWPARVARGGDVLAPGDGTDEAQCIDVRDLAAFLLRCAEDGVVGTYNAVGFEGRVSFAELLHGAKCALRHDVTFTWVPAAFLAAQKVGPWHNLPLWIPPEGNGHVSAEKARAKGLGFRPLAQTIADTAAWVRETKRDVAWGTGRHPGLSPAREAEVLAAFRAK
ncbi:MAG: NAD-dependent epimerase/dehydratase family protein [Planctomycetia bacterium]|nr:NAD-dependent epimerase/dehydratase family protein [Planctomycetia bacterium]